MGGTTSAVPSREKCRLPRRSNREHAGEEVSSGGLDLMTGYRAERGGTDLSVHGHLGAPDREVTGRHGFVEDGDKYGPKVYRRNRRRSGRGARYVRTRAGTYSSGEGKVGQVGLLMLGASTPEAHFVSERASREVAARAERAPGSKVEIHGGIASYPKDAQDAVTLTCAADAAIYRQKASWKANAFRFPVETQPEGMLLRSIPDTLGGKK